MEHDTSSKQELISIIMPVYNTLAYLDASAGSVLAQSYPEWELLMVDDGSTDGSGPLCDALAQRDSRIRVFHTENRGVSHARNLALKQARGACIAFLDSDDCYDPLYLETLMRMRKEAGDMPVCCGYYNVSETGRTAPARPLKEKLLSIDRFLFEMLTGRISLPLCCCTWLLPVRAAKKQSFDESLRFGEDSLFMAHVLTEYERIYYDPVPLYLYRMDRIGNTVTERSLRKAESRFDSMKRMYHLYRDKGPMARQALAKQLVECASEAARAARREGQGKEYKEYRKKGAKAWKRLRACPDISCHDKIRLLGYTCFPMLSEKVMLRIYGRV